MKRILSIFIAIVMLSLLTLSASAYNETVSIDMQTTFQTIDGFGASYTWYSEWLSQSDVAEQGFDWIFNDAEFNILRFRDLNCVYTNDRAEVLASYDNYYAYYNAAVTRGIDPWIIVTSWGEYNRELPWVDFVENPTNGYSYYTLAKNENGEYMYDVLADFCVESIKIFFDAGIPVHFFSITNEAELQDSHLDEQGGRRENAGFFLGQQETEYQAAYWKAHIAVYEAFEKEFGEYAPKLLGAETMAAYPDLLHGYLDPVIENCPESLEIVAHHLYGTDLSQRNLKSVGDAFPEYKIYQTEWYNGDYFGHAETMLDVLVSEGVNAYLYWDGVWPMGAVIDISNSNGTTIDRRGNHYIMSHFSKFIKRGYQRVDVSEDLDVKFAAFKSPDGSKLIVIAMNPSNYSEYITLDIKDKTIKSSNAYVSTENQENSFKNKYLQNVGEYADEFEIPARSLVTIDIDLEPDKDYVKPIAEEKTVNPFVADPNKPSAPYIPIICGSALIIAIVIGVVITIVRKKGGNKDGQ